MKRSICGRSHELPFEDRLMGSRVEEAARRGGVAFEVASSLLRLASACRSLLIRHQPLSRRPVAADLSWMQRGDG